MFCACQLFVQDVYIEYLYFVLQKGLSPREYAKTEEMREVFIEAGQYQSAIQYRAIKRRRTAQ